MEDEPKPAGNSMNDIRKTPMEMVHDFRKQIPVDVRGLALALGASVEQGWMDPSLTGSLKKAEEEFLITLNGDNSPKQQRIILAHLLGHCILHSHLIQETVTEPYDPGIMEQQENEANEFAMDLLLPIESIKELRAKGITTPGALAERLQVPLAAMNSRLAGIEV